MNGMFNNNFVVGMLLARDLPRQDQLLTGLVAGQMPANSPIGPLLLKPIIDARVAADGGRTSAEAEASGLRQALEIELPAGTRTVTLRVPDASGVAITASGGATVDADGKVTLPETVASATIAIAADGVVREVTVRAALAATPSGGTRSGPRRPESYTSPDAAPKQPAAT